MKRLNWNDALDYANSEDMFVPSKEQAIDLKLPKGVWTSTTYHKDFTKVWVHGEENPVSKFNEIRYVFLVTKLITKQKLSYRTGDV